VRRGGFHHPSDHPLLPASFHAIHFSEVDSSLASPSAATVEDYEVLFSTGQRGRGQPVIESQLFCLKCGSHQDSGRVEDNFGRCPDCASERLVRWPTRRSTAQKPHSASPTPATAARRVHYGLLVSTLLVATALGLSGKIVAAAVAAGLAGITSWAVLMYAILKPRYAGRLRPQTPVARTRCAWSIRAGRRSGRLACGGNSGRIQVGATGPDVQFIRAGGIRAGQHGQPAPVGMPVGASVTQAIQ